MDQQKFFINAVEGSSLDLSCRLSDPVAEVSLWHGAKERVPDGKKITKEGQIFTIHNVSVSDVGSTILYKCRMRSHQNGKAEDFIIGSIVHLLSTNRK